ncbi:MAG: hypothetical protein WCC74_01670 [Minisyncoccia bacterium]
MPIAFWFFILSFFFLTIMISVRAFELSGGYKILEVDFVRKTDIMVHNFFHLLRKQFSRISIGGIYRFMCGICIWAKDTVIDLKKGFDSRQPKFFIKQTKSDIIQNGSASFFLKKVSEYKDSIRQK